jgi:hypothetical protein
MQDNPFPIALARMRLVLAGQKVDGAGMETLTLSVQARAGEPMIDES